MLQHRDPGFHLNPLRRHGEGRRGGFLDIFRSSFVARAEYSRILFFGGAFPAISLLYSHLRKTPPIT
jgi:hypothetical protein